MRKCRRIAPASRHLRSLRQPLLRRQRHRRPAVARSVCRRRCVIGRRRRCVVDHRRRSGVDDRRTGDRSADDGAGHDASSDRAPAPAGTTPAAATAPAAATPSGAAAPATAAVPAATTPSTDGQDVIRHRALERGSAGERAGRCGIRGNCKPCCEQSRRSKCRHVSLHWVPPLLFRPQAKDRKCRPRLGQFPVNILMVNTVAEFQGNDDCRFICSRCAPRIFARRRPSRAAAFDSNPASGDMMPRNRGVRTWRDPWETGWRSWPSVPRCWPVR